MVRKEKTLLIIGSGAREHALGVKLLESPHVKKIYFAPGNAGTQAIGTNVEISVDQPRKLLDFALKNKIDLTVVGPELALSCGVVDLFHQHNLTIFGPREKAAKLETSKIFSAQFMEKNHIPTPRFWVCKSILEVYQVLRHVDWQKGIVIKADGQALGKGVFLPENEKEAMEITRELMVERILGSSGDQLLIQEKLTGTEVSLLFFCDGKTAKPMVPAQDYKRIWNHDKGPNTGGVGAYAPSSHVTNQLIDQITQTVVTPTLRGMSNEETPFSGVLYVGLMLTEAGPKVLEFNTRFGDPETQVILPLLKSDLYEILENCARGRLQKSTVEFSNNRVVCVVLTADGYPESPKIGEEIVGLKKAQDVFVFHAATCAVDQKIVTNGGRVLSVVATAKTIKEARQKIYQAIGAKGIHFAKMQYRTDIAFRESEEPKITSEKPRVPEIETAKAIRIEVSPRVLDMRAESRHKNFISQGFSSIEKVEITDVYTISKKLVPQELQKVQQVLTNPVSQISELIDGSLKPQAEKIFSWVIEVGYLPGVTDNIAHTVREIIIDLLHLSFVGEEDVYSSQMTFISGDLSLEEISKLAESMINPLIQRVAIKSYTQYVADGGMDIVVPKVTLSESAKTVLVDLDLSDEELISLGKQGILDAGKRRGPLALDLIYLKTIREYFAQKGRKPTDIELESIAQTWSEHCKHTIFNDPLDDLSEGLFKTYIKRATDEITQKQLAMGNRFCASVFTDNSGAIFFEDEYLISYKVETHNSPSALDPFGGAITGIVGVNRDALGFGLGAKPIANFYGFCLADPSDQSTYYRGQEQKEPLLSARQIFEGVVAGVNSGGNCSGIPTPQGFFYFDPRFRGKPLVFVGTLGLMPRQNGEKLLTEKQARPGDFIVMIGGKVGLDGIHGATFSSESLSSGSPATAVQIGDPITQKKLSDFLIHDARDLGLYTSITDNGAGGLSCSVAEMAKESGGCEVQLEKVPLKYPGLLPWQIWISESQERMTLSVPTHKWELFKELASRRDVEATVIGTFTDSGKCIVYYGQEKVMDVDMAFLHDGLPKKQQKASYPYNYHPEAEIPPQENLTQTFVEFLSDLSIASFEKISRQYDHEVQGTSVLKPLQGKGRVNSDVSIVRPLLEKNSGILLTQALYPSYSEIDTYHMTAACIDSAVRQVVASGGSLDKTALLDNFCWTDATNPERLGQLKQAAEACYDYATVYGTPFISGKDSMFNDFKGYDAKGNPVTISIPPTLLISAISVVPDVTRAVSLDFKAAGDSIYMVGETFAELGGSLYVTWWNSKNGQTAIGNTVPKVAALKNRELYEKISICIQKGLIASSISIGKGGLGVALAKSSMAGELGITVTLAEGNEKKMRPDYMLFSESQGRILVSVSPLNVSSFEKEMQGVPVSYLGKVGADQNIRIFASGKTCIVDTTVMKSEENYKKQFGILGKQPPQALVLTGYGINCEEESAFAFEKAGGNAKISHINDVIDGHARLSDYEIVVFPGGFAFADDTGSGNAFALKLKNHIWDKIQKYIADDHLIIGMCNGFQVLVNLGLLPALDKNYGEREVALLHNDSAIYTVRWVDLSITNTSSPWLLGIESISLPIAHGEGRFYAPPETLLKLKEKKLIAAQYVKGAICSFQSLEANPNGSQENIAAITDETGRIFGIMPHPERAIRFTHLPNWTFIKEKLLREGKPIPEDGPGLKLFQNAINYFA